MDRDRKRIKAMLKNALFVPTYPQDIFSVKAPTTNEASVSFREGQSELIHKSGTRFDIKEYNRLYDLNTINDVTDDSCNDIQTWHRFLPHCIYEDVCKLQDVVEGMQIKGKVDKSKLGCDICTQGKCSNQEQGARYMNKIRTSASPCRSSWPC